ncbi:hypothetical protein E3Q06_00026 [Wallemia mellicola]|nr:hypothetical protein E3Q21_00026 [Wallemia mellicola]TIB92724.1 hypothetical protein E3Q20_00026 [Wallemia mellicola]TIC44423.1 hypothetical protein E3Q07_00026 [Wallemia mellicola]TIC53573.1 hypothetical protein E3Q06_00026 [Wallemia mellicola]
MSASLANLPTEIIHTLIKEHKCYSLRCISKRLYSIAIDIIYTGKLYSPKTPSSNDSTLMSVQSYLQFLQRTPGMAYAESIKELYLNLDHFTGNARFEECGEMSACIKTFPNLETVEITYERMFDEEDIPKLVGYSNSVKELTINIHKIDTQAIKPLVEAIVDQYPKLQILKVQRPSFVRQPGFDLSAQKSFITYLTNAAVSHKKLKTVLIKNYRIDIQTGFNRITVKTNANYIHIYNKTKRGYEEKTHTKSKKVALRRYYPQCTDNVDTPSRESHTYDLLDDFFYESLCPKLQKYARTDVHARDNLRSLIVDEGRARSQYLHYDLEDYIDWNSVDSYFDYCYGGRNNYNR